MKDPFLPEPIFPTPYSAAKYIIFYLVYRPDRIHLNMPACFGMEREEFFGKREGDFLVILEFNGKEICEKFPLRQLHKEVLLEIAQKF